MKHILHLLSLASALVLVTPVAAGNVAVERGSNTHNNAEEQVSSPATSHLSEWWNGKYMTGNWFGVRESLADHGITFSGKYEGIFFGVLASENGSRGFYDQELAFSGDVDFAKLLKNETFEGLSGFAGVRWRDQRANSNPNNFVEASSLFQPSNNQSGTEWRLLTFGLQYVTPELFGIKELLTLRGGWIQPQKEFIDQPLSKLFINNAIESGKGVGGNIPFSSSFSTWGGTLKIKPVKDTYVKTGFFMSYPDATSSGNNGLAFAGYESDTSRNGLMVMTEAGITPKIGPSRLPGKYAMGGYYWGDEKASFNGTPHYGQSGFYWQADQMLFREPSSAARAKNSSDGKSLVDGKSLTAPVEVKTELSKQGLYTFNLISFAPEYNNAYPFFFQTGLVYEGLIPTRDADKLMFALASGSYSRANPKATNPNTVVLEWDYRVQINQWAYVQPFVQYLIRPNSNSAIGNAAILGFAYSVNF